MVAQTTTNKTAITGTLDAVEVSTTYPYRKEGQHANYQLQIHTYSNSLSGTYQVEVSPPGANKFTPVPYSNGTVIEWTDQGVVFVFNPAASCDVRLNMTARSSGSLDYSIRAG